MKAFTKQNLLVFGLVAAVALLFPETAHAAPAWEEALQKVVDILTGNTARLLAMLAVIGFGLGALFGHISWRRAGEIVIAIAIVFSAASIVDMFAGGSI